MKQPDCHFTYQDAEHHLALAFVEGTLPGEAFVFGQPQEEQAIFINDFFISKHLVTQALWKHIMGDERNRSANPGNDNPVEHVSWHDVAGKNGFIEKLNKSNLREQVTAQLPGGIAARFRLPTETGWEYAARGGRHWRDNYLFGGSNNPDEVAWYLENSENHTWPVGLKKPNQLGLYDMNGNLWEWCQDWFIRDTAMIPKNGGPYRQPTRDKVLRGGCHHNMPIHCTNTKRYEIPPDSFDGCIGFRLALQIGPVNLMTHYD